MERVILHCDCNAFFASVELLSHPELQAVPVAVGHDDDSRHGIILAKNEAAKKFGVSTAETIGQARRKCPGLIVLPPHHEKYRAYSEKLNEIYGQYSDLVEPFGIDESWLDVTGSLHLFAKSGGELADLIRGRVKRELGLTLSIGVSFNKIYAKLGSDYKKPDATTVISRENCAQIVGPMPVSNMIFVGKAAEQQLWSMGIRTLGALALADEAQLTRAFGKMGRQLRIYAAGEDDSPVAAQHESEQVKSIGNGITFKRDLQGLADIRTGAGYLADEVASRLRKKALKCTVVQVQIKSPALQSISRQKTLARETDLGKEIAEAAVQLICANWRLTEPIRALTITAERLVTGPVPRQMGLFDTEEMPPDPAREKLERAMDTLREKYGQGAVSAANLIGNDLGLAQPDQND